MKTYPTLILLLTLPCIAQSKLEEKIVPEHRNPPAEVPDGLPAKAEIIINVLEGGGIKVEGVLVTQEELSKKLKIIADKFADQPVRIRGDRKVPYGTIVDVIDVCHKAGIWHISLATIRTKQETEQVMTLNRP